MKLVITAILWLARVHRVLLIIATAILAIAASRVAASAKLGTWLMLLGGAVLMYLADVLREVEDKAQDLARSSGHDAEATREDVLMARGLRGTVAMAILGFTLVAAGYAKGA